MAELLVPGVVAVLRLRRQITSDWRMVFFPGAVGVDYGGGVKLLAPLIFGDGGGDGIASAEDSRRLFVLCFLVGMELLCFPLGSFLFWVGEVFLVPDLCSGSVPGQFMGGLMRIV
jgi:hypothetical protein